MSDFDPPLDFSIDLTTIRERLKLLNYFIDVEGIEEAAYAMENETGYPPRAYVSVASETAEPNKLIGGIAQVVHVSISILFCEPYVRSDQPTRDVVEKTRRAIIRQLVGFVPDRAERFLEYDRYTLRAISGGCIWGEVLFRTRYRFTQA